MPHTESSTPATELVRFILDKIPLARAMQLELSGWGEDFLSLYAPLAPNSNDKGCAFGGSLASLMTLSGWALVELTLRRRDLACDVFVAESTIRYQRPVWQGFHSEARLAPGAGWSTFLDTLAARGKARVAIECVVPDTDGEPAASLATDYVAKLRPAAA